MICGLRQFFSLGTLAAVLYIDSYNVYYVKYRNKITPVTQNDQPAKSLCDAHLAASL